VGVMISHASTCKCGICRIYARRAAAAGMTRDEWRAHILREHREQCHRSELCSSRPLQWAVITQHAARNGRRFTVQS
jgi:hypothetical protein